MTTRVYKYGLQPPIENADRVEQQMRLGHGYYNVLTLIELERRRLFRAVRSRHPDIEPIEAEVAALEARLAEARGVILGSRRAARRRAESRDDKSRVKAVLIELREPRGRLKAARAAFQADAEARAEIDRIDAWAKRTALRARAAIVRAGLYWGTYLIVEQAVDAARKAKDPRTGRPVDPKIKRWTRDVNYWHGDGAVAVQIQKGMSISDAEDDTRFRICVLPLRESGTKAAKRRISDAHMISGTRRRPYAYVQLRVGSNGRAPIFAAFSAVYHRPVPEGAEIMWAKVTRRREGRKERWELHLTLRGIHSKAAPSARGAAAIDIGWRLRPSGDVRVGYLRDEEGRAEEILVPERIATGIDKADSLRSIRDRNLNEMQSALAAWLRERDVPAWLRTRAVTLALWRSPARFAALARAWREQRFAGDVEGYDLLEAWRYRDQHLWDWETNQRQNTLNQRRELYRVTAARLADRYRELVLEKGLDLSEFQENQPPEGDVQIPEQKAQQRRSSPGEFRLVLVQAFKSRGGVVTWVPCQYTTRTCHSCGSVEEWDQAILMHVCAACALEWDQDDNAARNLLAWRERSGAPDDGVPARPSRSERFAAAKRRRREVIAGESGGARDEEDSYAASEEK